MVAMSEAWISLWTGADIRTNPQWSGFPIILWYFLTPYWARMVITEFLLYKADILILA